MLGNDEIASCSFIDRSKYEYKKTRNNPGFLFSLCSAIIRFRNLQEICLHLELSSARLEYGLDQSKFSLRRSRQ